jgi:tRNA pseudouridine32 synthase/23S rRNA pseudouridine746 synthase
VTLVRRVIFMQSVALLAQRNLLRSAAASAVTRSIDVLFRDENFIVVDKPFDVVTQAEGSEDTVERIVERVCGVPKVWFPHQLDYATSGVICLALSSAAAAYAGEHFSGRSASKEYRALVYGHVPTGTVLIDAEIAPWDGQVEIVPRGREGQIVDFRQSVGTAANPGKPSQTRVICLECGYFLGHAASRVALFPLTGRRHQLRVHCLHAGFPIIGDGSYSRLPPKTPAQCSDPSSPPTAALREPSGAGNGDVTAVDLSSVRMMLHAHRLTFAASSSVKCSKKRQRVLDSMSTQSGNWVAPDPFEGVLLDCRPPAAVAASFAQSMRAGCTFVPDETCDADIYDAAKKRS